MQLSTENARRSKFWLVTYSMAWNAVKMPLTLPTSTLPHTAVTSGAAKCAIIFGIESGGTIVSASTATTISPRGRGRARGWPPRPCRRWPAGSAGCAGARAAMRVDDRRRCRRSSRRRRRGSRGSRTCSRAASAACVAMTLPSLKAGTITVTSGAKVARARGALGAQRSSASARRGTGCARSRARCRRRTAPRARSSPSRARTP